MLYCWRSKNSDSIRDVNISIKRRSKISINTFIRLYQRIEKKEREKKEKKTTEIFHFYIRFFNFE